jgi:large subunit ribosomal protein L31
VANKKQKGFAMKKGIHPDYHEINVTRTDGKTVKMYSSVKKDLVLSTDNLNHSAWTGQRSNAGEKGRRTESFKKKYAGFGF